MFRVFPKLNVPNGTAYWKIEGWPNGKRKRYWATNAMVICP
jgi:hypothetical protein